MWERRLEAVKWNPCRILVVMADTSERSSGQKTHIAPKPGRTNKASLAPAIEEREETLAGPIGGVHGG